MKLSYSLFALVLFLESNAMAADSLQASINKLQEKVNEHDFDVKQLSVKFNALKLIPGPIGPEGVRGLPGLQAPQAPQARKAQKVILGP